MNQHFCSPRFQIIQDSFPMEFIFLVEILGRLINRYFCFSVCYLCKYILFGINLLFSQKLKSSFYIYFILIYLHFDEYLHKSWRIFFFECLVKFLILIISKSCLDKNTILDFLYRRSRYPMILVVEYLDPNKRKTRIHRYYCKILTYNL